MKGDFMVMTTNQSEISHGKRCVDLVKGTRVTKSSRYIAV